MTSAKGWSEAFCNMRAFNLSCVQAKTAMFLFGSNTGQGMTREGDLGSEYGGVATIRAKRLARLQLATLAAALAADPKVASPLSFLATIV